MYGPVYKTAPISGGKRTTISVYIGCLLAIVIRSKLLSVQLDHPVSQAYVRFVSGITQIYFRYIHIYLKAYLRNISSIFQVHPRHIPGINQVYL